jgi:hypothetical protein
VKRVWSAGAFATGLLVFATQLRTGLALGFGVALGDSPASDFVLLQAADDLLRDITAEALVITAWRVYRTSASNEGRSG